jgi:mono/diheme cytochrome c family protein
MRSEPRLRILAVFEHKGVEGMKEKKAWKKLAVLPLALLVGAAVAYVSKGTDATAADARAKQEAVDRGRYLVTAGGCHDCHTPWTMGPSGPEPDMTRMLSGHPRDVEMPEPPPLNDAWAWSGAGTNTAFAGPWGVSFAANLSPDEFTGTGIWTEDIFINTIRNGRHWGVARPLLPPMPWFNYAKLTDEDLKAIFAYLRTIPPIRNEVPEPIPPVAAPAGD